MGYTTFAKFVRKLMIDNDENLSNLAKLFNVSIAFVSSVFTGKKAIPEKWYDEIVSHYKLEGKDKKELLEVYSESKESLKIDLSNTKPQNKKLAIQFQRKLDNLSEEDIKKLEELFKED